MLWGQGPVFSVPPGQELTPQSCPSTPPPPPELPLKRQVGEGAILEIQPLGAGNRTPGAQRGQDLREAWSDP